MDVLEQFLQNSTPIYNRYLSGDFKVGTDNLNPKRELEITNDLDALRLSLYSKYKDQINLAKGDGATKAPADLGTPYIDRTQVSVPVSIRDGMAPTETPVPIEQDLYKALKVIDAFLGDTPVTLDDLPFDICSDRSGGKVAGTPGVTPGGANYTTGLIGSGNTGNTNAASTGSGTSMSDMKCVMVEIQLLMFIFELIKMVQKLLALEKRALAFIYPYIEFAQMIVACILNPAMRQQLIMALVGQGMSMIIGFLTNQVAQWLASLNLECLMSNVMSKVQSVLGTINGVGDLGSAVGSFVSFNANIVAGAEKGAGVLQNASQGNSKALYQALGIPEKDQAKAATLTAGGLADMFMNSGVVISLKSIKNIAVGVYGSTVGSVVGSVQGAINGVSTSMNSIEGSAKLIKDYFPGGEFSTW
jgi:hypothetical protein